MMIVILVLLGLCFGSFINALVWRLHEQAESIKKRRDTKLSISKGRSMCVHCGHELAVRDLIPVFSWLSLRGKCRYCHASISTQYPVVEVLTAVSFVVSYLEWPLNWDTTGWLQFSLWLGALVILIALLIYDAKWMLLPDRLVWPGVIIALVFASLMVINASNSIHQVSLTVGSVAITSGLFWVLFMVSDGQWIGGGDVKLGIMLGLLLGSPYLGMLMLFLASLLGTMWALPSLIKGSGLKIKVPFGPFLITATILVFLYGQPLIDWYNNLFIL